MELADDERHIRAAVELKVRHTAVIKVIADDIAVLGGGGSGARIAPGKPATEVKLVGRHFFDHFLRRPKILIGCFRVKGGQVIPGLFLVGRAAVLQQRFPRFMLCLPSFV